MTTPEVRELFAYNACFAALEPLPAESYFRDLKSSHGGLHGTLCHIVWAEQLWLNRWLAQPNPAVPQGRDLSTLAEARARWEAIETEREPFLAGLTERRLDETVAVKPSTGGSICTHSAKCFATRSIIRPITGGSSSRCSTRWARLRRGRG